MERALSSRIGIKALAPERHQQIRGVQADRRNRALIKEELWNRKTLQLARAYSDALRGFRLDPRNANTNRAGDYVIEINRNYRRNIVIGIRIIRVGPAARGPSQEKHEAKNDTAQRPMRKQ